MPGGPRFADQLYEAWQVAWGGHAIFNQPLSYFQGNILWPVDDTLALTDALVGYAPAGTLGSGSDAALIRYDILFIGAYALAFVGAYLLAREFRAGAIGSVTAGAAFAYAPWRLAHVSHLNILSSGGIPLSLFLSFGATAAAPPLRPWPAG